MKRRYIEAYLEGTLEQTKEDTRENLALVSRQLEDTIALRSEDLNTIMALSDIKLNHEIESLRLDYASKEYIEYIISSAKTQCQIAEARYLQFDEDEQSTAEKVSLLIAWGKSLVTVKICNQSETEEKSNAFRAEASKLFKQLALRRCGEEKCVSLETWLTAMADVLKIFAKLHIPEQDISLFLSFCLSENIIR